MMQIQVNGERRQLSDESRLSDLLKDLSLVPERVAVELNHQVVRRSEWPNTILKEGDRVEIVHFVGGGEQKAGSRRQEAEGRKQKAVSSNCVVISISSGLRAEVPKRRLLTATRLRPSAQG